MCGIPMLPTADNARGRKLTFDEAMAHIGGIENLLTAEGRDEIARNVKHYLWKYPDGTCWCTACGQEAGNIRGRHGDEIACPRCAQAAELRHEARGHSKLFDQFDYRHWRRSMIDTETVILTITQVWRDSRLARPERAELHVKPTAIYLFRGGSPATVYKNHAWYRGDDREYWNLQKDVRPENTVGGAVVPFVDGGMGMRGALRGTGMGRVYELVCKRPYEHEDVNLIANCAARPYLEYLAKCGQGALAHWLSLERCVSRDIIPRPRAKTPRELLGLTEGQWYEVRRDGIQLDENTLKVLRAMGRMGFQAPKVAEARAYSSDASRAERISPWRGNPQSIDALTRGASDKLRRGIFRAAMRDLLLEYRADYYRALVTCGEDMTDAALMLPRDLKAMHDRYTARAAAIIEEEKAEVMRRKERAHLPRLMKLRAQYCFTACGLVLRPYETVKEILDEGKALRICIGTYAERYLEGGTIICCLRRAEEPDVPFHAVEFSAAGRIVQDRGYKNTATHSETPGNRRQIEGFWRAFNRRERGRMAV